MCWYNIRFLLNHFLCRNLSDPEEITSFWSRFAFYSSCRKIHLTYIFTYNEMKKSKLSACWCDRWGVHLEKAEKNAALVLFSWFSEYEHEVMTERSPLSVWPEIKENSFAALRCSSAASRTEGCCLNRNSIVWTKPTKLWLMFSFFDAAAAHILIEIMGFSKPSLKCWMSGRSWKLPILPQWNHLSHVCEH